MPACLQGAGNASLAATNLEGLAAWWSHDLVEECRAIDPVGVVAGLAGPPHPVFRLAFPARVERRLVHGTQTYGVDVRACARLAITCDCGWRPEGARWR